MSCAVLHNDVARFERYRLPVVELERNLSLNQDAVIYAVGRVIPGLSGSKRSAMYARHVFRTSSRRIEV